MSHQTTGVFESNTVIVAFDLSAARLRDQAHAQRCGGSGKQAR